MAKLQPMNDKTIKCIECAKVFIFSVKEQEYFQTMNFNEPKRCKKCKSMLKEAKTIWKGGVYKNGNDV